jgi:hypothetical protein
VSYARQWNEHDEARTLLGLLHRGVSTADDLRRLISISQADADFLRKTLHPNMVRQLMAYRLQVLAEFENLLAKKMLHSDSASPSV